MKIGLIDVDGHSGFPNFALCKISAYYKSKGYTVEFYDPLSAIQSEYDIVYCSKVFSFTPNYAWYIKSKEVYYGGTGCLNTNRLQPHYQYMEYLDDAIEKTAPDLSLYPKFKHALGFLTRGCIRKCSWCLVPAKEGNIKPYDTIENIIQNRKTVVLMDNNVLACEHGINELKKIAEMNIKVDFNQGLDARLVTPEIAEILAKIKWIRYPRFSCDTTPMIEPVKNAITLLREAVYRGEVFIYVLLNGTIEECNKRILELDFMDYTDYTDRTYKIKLFAQPYIDFYGAKRVPEWQLDMATWINRKPIFYSCRFEDYQPRKGFYCREYFKE